VATLGTGAPTAKIAQEAGLAEGTLFTYFANKDALLNELFLEIEAELAGIMLEGYPAGAAPRERCRHMWDRFIDWCARHPMKHKAMRQLKVSDRISAESKKRGDLLFQEVKTLLAQNLAGHAAKENTPDYNGAVLGALAEMTLEFIARHPRKREPYKQAGFEAFWKAIGR
ncbi:MAG: TetR/AcrR family transcriptional regulator, partial [Dongiaceae bacterium]